MKLSIITVSWNVKDKLRECLRSVFEHHNDLVIEYFVVDNNSHDGTVEMLRAEFPAVHVIANMENKGFAYANNQAIKESSGDFVLLLNPDMRVLPDTLSHMVKWMSSHPQAGISSCKLIDEHNSINFDALPRRFPGVFDQAAIMLKIPHLFPKVLDRYLYNGFDTEKEQIVDSVRGSFFMISRNILNILHGLDERYFIWFEEVDFCKQVLRAGFEVWYVPSADCVDYIGQSFKQQPGLWRQKQFTRSMVIYFNKWHPGMSAWFIRALRPIAIIIYAISCATRRVER